MNALVGAGEQRRRHVEAQRLGGLEIDDELEPGGLHDRQFRRLFPFEDAPGVERSHRSVLPQAAECHGRLPIKDCFRAESKHKGK